MGLGQIGDYPAEWKPKVHGPYDPSKFYGKADTALGEVKLGQLASWLSRRSWTPQAFVRAVGRTQWRWAKKYLLVKNGGVAPVAHFALFMGTCYYFLQYRSHTNHRVTKYHW